MLKVVFSALLPLLVFTSDGSDQLLSVADRKGALGDTGTLEKLIVANGSVVMELDQNRLNGAGHGVKSKKPGVLRFKLERNAFFTVLVFNNELRGPLPSSMGLIPQNWAAMPARLKASSNHLVLESMPWGAQSDLVIRASDTGLILFNIEG